MLTTLVSDRFDSVLTEKREKRYGGGDGGDGGDGSPNIFCLIWVILCGDSCCLLLHK